jgi:hypothetical protein
MATVTKDFRIKSGLVVEGTTGTINGSPILTEAASVEFLQDTIGGMVSSNTESGISVEYDDTSGKLNFNVGDPVITIAGDVDGNATMTNLGDTTITVTLDTVNTAVGTYGSTTAIPAITVDGKGRVTNVTTNSISTTLGISGDTGTDSVALGADTLNFSGGAGITSIVSDNKVTLDIDSTVVATLSDQQTLTNKILSTNVDLGADLDAATYKIVNLGTPTSTADAATKGYVDSVSQGLSIKEAVRVATTAAVTLSTDLENGDTLDGVTLATGNRILVKNQAAGSENGIYTVNATGAPTRATDANVSSEVTAGMFTFVSEGTSNGNTSWVLTTDNPITLDTTALVFTQFAGAGTFTAGTGLDLNGTEFVLDLSEVDTTTLPEGTNKYYTDERVDDRVDGLLVGGTGISKTYNDEANSLTLALDFAEFSTTDVAEGTKLFFTNQRAVDALQAVVPDFTEIEVNNIARQVAATVSAPTAATAVTAFAFAKASYRSAKFLVKVAYTSHTEVSEVLLTLDTSDNIAITEYAVVGTNGSSSAISADIDGTNVRLRVTPVNASSTVTVMGTLLV